MDPKNKERLLSVDGGGDGNSDGLVARGVVNEGREQEEEVEEDIFDTLLEAAGSHGKFQIWFNSVFNYVLSAVVSMSFLNYVMAMTVPDHWCHVPGSQETNFTTERWKELTLPREVGTNGETSFSKCKMFNVTLEDILREEYSNDSVTHKEIIDCQFGWDYDRTWYSRTAPSDHDWVCDNELRVTNTFMYSRMGDVVGAFVFGQLGDVLGRKKVFIAAVILLVIGRVAIVLTASIYPLFALCIFLSNSSLLTVFQSPLSIGMEFCSKEMRSRINMLQCIGWTLGISFTPLLAWAISDWTIFSLSTSIPSVLFVIIIKWMPESPRWLMTKGRPEEALIILEKIAETNGRKPLPPDSLSRMKASLARTGTERFYGIASLFSSKRLTFCTILILICWVINSLAYYSFVLNVANLSGNPFMNYFYQSLVELPASVLGKWSTDKFGRRWTQSVFFIFFVLACAVLTAVVQYDDLAWLTVVVAISAKFFVCITFYGIYLSALEIYPTCLRQTGLSTNSLISSVIGMLGPYIVYLGTSVDSRYPYIILGICSIVGAVCSSFLPETLHAKLPETMAEAQNFGRGQKYWSLPKIHASKPLKTESAKDFTEF